MAATHPRHLRRLTVLLAAALLGGCMTSTFTLQDGTPFTPDMLNNPPADLQLPFALGDTEFDYWGGANKPVSDNVKTYFNDNWTRQGIPLPNDALQQYFLPVTNSNASETIDITLHNTRWQPPPAGTMIPNIVLTLFSAFLIPTYGKIQVESEMEIRQGDTVIWQQKGGYNESRYLGWLPLGQIRKSDDLENAMRQANFRSHQKQLAAQMQREATVFASVANSTDIEALKAAVLNPQLLLTRPMISKRLANQLATRKDRIEQYRNLIALRPDFAAYIPGNEGLLFVGPPGFMVLDLLKQTQGQKSSPIVAASVRSAGKPYKNFSLDESAWLIKQGIPEDVISAMIEVSGRQAPTMGSATTITTTTMNAGSALTAGSAPQAAAGSAVENAAAECAKAYAAKKACEQMPSDPFGVARKACVAGVKKKFGGVSCPIPL